MWMLSLKRRESYSEQPEKLSYIYFACRIKSSYRLSSTVKLVLASVSLKKDKNRMMSEYWTWNYLHLYRGLQLMIIFMVD